MDGFGCHDCSFWFSELPRHRARVHARSDLVAGTSRAGDNTSMATSKSARGSRMSQAHKDALAAGRDQSRIVKRYLEALEQTRTHRRTRAPSQDVIRRQLDDVERALANADALGRLHLLQRRKDLEMQLSQRDELAQLAELEEAFVAVAASYGQRKGISFDTWREVGVSPAVLRRAGITPSGRSNTRAHPGT